MERKKIEWVMKFDWSAIQPQEKTERIKLQFIWAID